MDKEIAPIGKCYKCGADLYATLGLCDSCRCEQLEAGNAQKIVAIQALENIRDELQARNKRLREVFDHPNHSFPNQKYLDKIGNAICLLNRFAKINDGGEYAFGIARQLEQFIKRAKQTLKGK